jgi:5-formyltetrahydrofolate cyclo-ligase
MTSKRELRQVMSGRLATLDVTAIRSASAAVWERLATLPAFAQAERLLIYVSHGAELETHGLIQQLLALGRQVCVPRFDRQRHEYEASRLMDFATDLEPGQLGILEPVAAAVRPVDMQEIEVALVPGRAFSRSGTRLGRGKGYFDRLLAGMSGTKIGLAFSFQVVERVPFESHDVHMDYIVTETELVTCQEIPA